MLSTLAFLAVILAPAGKLRGASAVAQAGISTPALNSAATETEVVPGDDVLRSYLGQSELVVIGEFLFLNKRSVDPEPFQVVYAIKGEPQTYIQVGEDWGWPGPNMDYPDGDIVLFLYRRQVRGSNNLEPYWRPRDLKFGALPATPTLVASLKRLAAIQTPNSGEEQLGVLMRRFVPNCTLREQKYTLGDQTCSTAVLTGLAKDYDRRELKWVCGGHDAQSGVAYMHCPDLLGALWERSNVRSAQDAEDYVKLVFGLCAGPRALEYWTVKAEPMGDSWLVTPAYVGPPAEVRAVGPMELVFMNRATGNVADICERRPNFESGKTARVMRPSGMNPDGLDPAPAELDDPTLDYFLSRCEMVVVGTAMNDVSGGFVTGMRLHLRGEFKVVEAIKGKTVPGSILQVQVTQQHASILKKGEELVLFLNYQGGAARKGAEASSVWEKVWNADDFEFGAFPATPELVAALKRLAAEHGSALETPNLHWGAEVEGISVRLDTLGLGTVWKLGRDAALNINVADRGSNGFFFARDQRGGELEVDGAWYTWPDAANMFVTPANGANNPFSTIKVIVGRQWRAKTQAVGQSEDMGAPLNLAPGTHKIRFALIARRNAGAGSGPAPEIRAVSNPVEIEVREDTTLPARPEETAGVANPLRTPVTTNGAQYEVDGEILQNGYRRDGSIQFQSRAKFTVFVRGSSWLIHTTDHDESGKPLVERETACVNGAEIYEVATDVGNKNLDGKPPSRPTDSVGSIVSDNVPVGLSDDYFVCHLWMMFASASYFENLSTNWITPVYDLNASAPVQPDLRREARWKLINGPGTLPSRVVFPDARYAARGVTNAGTTPIPNGFVFDLKMSGYPAAPAPILPGQPVPPYRGRKQAVATVTAVRPFCSRGDLSPAAEGSGIVIDRRWKDPKAPSSLMDYRYQNGIQWLPVEQARQLCTKQHAPKSVPRPSP